MTLRLTLLLSVLAGLACSGPEARMEGTDNQVTGRVVGAERAAVLPARTASAAGNEGAAVTANPDASADAVRLLRALQSLRPGAENSVLVGQNMGHIEYLFEENVSAYYDGLKEQTGALPAIFAVDYGYEDPSPANIRRANEDLVSHCRAGGVVSISIHPKNPFTGGDVGDRSTGGEAFDAILTPGTPARANWLRTLDAVAVGLEDLQSKGVTVLWRPLHEMNGDWFWWSVERNGRFVAPEKYKALWRDMFAYYTEEKGLDNLLWVYSPNATLNDSTRLTDTYYPGGDVVDIVSLDYYYNDFSLLNNRGGYDRLVALGKPVALAEVGPANWARAHPKGQYDLNQVIDAIRNDYSAISYFTFWNGWSNRFRRSYAALTENQNTEELIGSREIVTLDEMPSVMGMPSCK